MPLSTVHFSSQSDEWATPQDLFDALNDEFKFDIDAAAQQSNTKCLCWFGPDHPTPEYRDALAVNWGGSTLRAAVAVARGEWHRAVWCNPPYSRGLQSKFIEKAAQERLAGVTTVMLLPARTDTKAFHKYIYDTSRWQARNGVEIRFLKGRLKFGGAKNSAPFPSMLVIFRPDP